MADTRPITIVGGGLAGLALGIALRRRDVPVTLYEAGPYPRHRVCGEFINGEGFGVLQRLGFEGPLRQAGMRPAHRVSFFDSYRLCAAKTLPDPAWCLSRYALDALLADGFRDAGGELRTNTRWRGDWSAGVVRATGRRASGKDGGWRFIGLKTHARGLVLESDLEMHWGPHGYVGINRVEGERVNICGLFRSHQPVARLAADPWSHPLLGPEDSLLRQRLRDAELDPASQQTVAGLSFRTYGNTREATCSIGDAFALIPPLTGNGMSLALESAEMAVEPLLAYSRGERDWLDAVARIEHRSQQCFRSRLRSARLLQSLLFRRTPRRFIFAVGKYLNPVWSALFYRLRG